MPKIFRPEDEITQNSQASRKTQETQKPSLPQPHESFIKKLEDLKHGWQMKDKAVKQDIKFSPEEKAQNSEKTDLQSRIEKNMQFSKGIAEKISWVPAIVEMMDTKQS